MRKRRRYLVEQIAIIMLALAFSSILFPHASSIINNQYDQPTLWSAIVMEIEIAWKALLVAVALILAMIAILYKHKEPDELKEIKESLDRIESALRLDTTDGSVNEKNKSPDDT